MKVFKAKGSDVLIFANGSVRKVLKCNIQLCEVELEENENEKLRKYEETVSEEKTMGSVKGAEGYLTLCQTKEKVGLNYTCNDTWNLQTTFLVPLTFELDGRMVFVMVH